MKYCTNCGEKIKSHRFVIFILFLVIIFLAFLIINKYTNIFKNKNSVIIKEKKYHLFKLSNKLTATQSQSP